MINKKYLSIIFTLLFVSFSAFAATGNVAEPLDADKMGGTADSAAAETDALDAKEEAPAVAPKGAISNYAEIPCDKDFFKSSSCNQCFDGGKKGVGEKITNLTDSWTNPNSGEQIIYSDEQIKPELINLGGSTTKWISNPKDASKFWKNSSEIVWTSSLTGSGKQEFLLEGGKTVNYLESDLGASYSMESTTSKEGQPVGLLKLPIVYHDIDNAGKESSSMTNNECVVYYAGAQQAPVAKAPVPEPKQLTKVKTGPESFILMLLAAIITFGFIRLRRKA